MMKEENIITLDNGARYLLLHDLDEIDGKRFFYAVGITPDDDIDSEDSLFFEVFEEDGETSVEKVDPESEVYKTLLTIELVDASLEADVPGVKEQVEQFVEDMEARESGN